MYRRLDFVVKLLVRFVDQALAQRIFFLLAHFRAVERVHPQDFVSVEPPFFDLGHVTSAHCGRVAEAVRPELSQKEPLLGWRRTVVCVQGFRGRLVAPFCGT